MEASDKIKRTRKNLIVPTRWVDTDKSDGNFVQHGHPMLFEAKRRLVVTGFRSKMLGFYRRDAFPASRLAESMLLALDMNDENDAGGWCEERAFQWKTATYQLLIARRRPLVLQKPKHVEGQTNGDRVSLVERDAARTQHEFTMNRWKRETSHTLSPGSAWTTLTCTKSRLAQFCLLFRIHRPPN